MPGRSFELDTPHGKLRAAWPGPQEIYFDSLEPVAEIWNEPNEPIITLNGREITRKRADQILRGMRLRALHEETMHPLAGYAADQSRGLIQWTPTKPLEEDS